uniref:NADH dehydrogenase subunit 1 n=1 Tax=Penicillidia jenynsii TaxID=1034756 RepID=UPI002E775112|nr:NADH dehydrogenase subunit 1 [Penicillidia jenynsii]WRI60695.1 NADH dehydrogenase subunit 1 [Penicillidia jenynsii]
MNNELILVICEILLLILFVLVGVGYLTLMERKVLGYIQIRKGPNKVSFMGLLQPICDAIKLFSKEQVYIMQSNYYSYLMAPVFSLFFSMLLWLSLPYFMNLISFDLSVIFFFCCISMNVYPLMVAGWSSNSKYALLGGLRGIAQTISYEISLVLIMMSLVFLINGYNLMLFMKYQEFIDMIIYLFPVSLVWFLISLAEVNRAPFDFAEGESELVSGFNIEYGGGGFAMIFLAEYMMIMYMSLLFSILFLGSNMFSFYFYMKFMFILFLFIWVRGTFPRFRYDKLMYLAWKSFLPFSLNMLMFIIGYKIITF